VPASAKDPEGWIAADKFTLMLETAGLNATELSAYCRERGLFPEQVDRWRKAAEDANAQPEVGAFYWTDMAPDIVNPGREEQGSVSV